MTIDILIGDCRARMAELADQSVHTCVTSPPYFGLRDYGCDGQIGLEPTPAEFLRTMVEVFREVRRVLRDDGTVWINIGDSYTSTPSFGRGGGSTLQGRKQGGEGGKSQNKSRLDGFKAKDLMGIPWRLAFALQDDGWYLRQDIIWSKPNPMPESVTDRCTKAHEYIFLLSKRDRYHFDHEAIKEHATADHPPGNKSHKAAIAYDNGDEKHRTKAGLVAYSQRQRGSRDSFKRDGSKRGVAHVGQNMGTHRPDRDDGQWDISKRNKRSVWTVATQGFKEAHFATYPPALIEPCILAGCPEGGTVLDPFGGAGTTGLVADRLKRNAILCELNPEYAEIAQKRINDDAKLFSEVRVCDGRLDGAA